MASAYQPRYEQPLLMLDSQFRDLNQSALALDRRGYNLVFHSAWRFASQGEETDPWLLIRAGQQLDDRHQIEGSLRFYTDPAFCTSKPTSGWRSLAMTALSLLSYLICLQQPSPNYPQPSTARTIIPAWPACSRWILTGFRAWIWITRQAWKI